MVPQNSKKNQDRRGPDGKEGCVHFSYLSHTIGQATARTDRNISRASRGARPYFVYFSSCGKSFYPRMG
jgi:hypothetical protein